MKRNQKGFGVVEGLLILIIVLLIGFIGYYVYHTKSGTNSSYKNTATSSEPSAYSGWQTYSDPAIKYSVKLPTGWKFTKGQPVLTNGQVSTDYQGKPIVGPDEVLPNDVAYDDITNALQVYTDNSSLSPVDYYTQNGAGRAGGIVSQNSDLINGYAAYSAKVTFSGATYYVITIVHKGKVVEFSYYPSSKYASDMDKLIKSTKFSN